MRTTAVYKKTQLAYNAGYRFIINRGSTRSSKTFSELQLIHEISDATVRRRIITVVSHSLPHLIGGAIRDFDRILEADGISPDQVRIKNPYIYTLGPSRSILEFVGFDNPGKALGAARDILFINEADKMPFSICHHLIQRTTETVFIDYNPACEFWIDTEGYTKRKDAIVIDSTFIENIENITEGQKYDLMLARKKALIEDREGRRGYWFNWWQVYGLGKPGQLEGAIFQNWATYKDLPEAEYYRLFVVDWGGHDPTTLTEINFNGDLNHLYIRNYLYQPQILNSELIKMIQDLNPENVPVICDSARKDKIFELQMAEINAQGATKGEGSIMDGIERLQEFTIFIHESSQYAINEFSSYSWIKDEKTGLFLNIPEDKNNHIIDPARYGARYYRRFIKPLK